jgi:predicted DsbA family dithiol-disulfide isomerase
MIRELAGSVGNRLVCLGLVLLSACGPATPPAGDVAWASTPTTAAGVESAAPAPAPTNIAVVATARDEEAAMPAPSATAPIVVDLHHDIICPWCRIGHERLVRAIAQFKAEQPGREVIVRHHPFLLEPETPPEGFDLRERLAAKYGADRLDGMFDNVTRVGAQDGIVFRFDKATRTPDTRPAHALVDAAPVEARERLLRGLHTAHFEAGRDLGATDVLISIWTEAGLDAASARAVLDNPAMRTQVAERVRAARVPGMRGVPHFVIGSTSIGGAQPVDTLVAALRQAAR